MCWRCTKICIVLQSAQNAKLGFHIFSAAFSMGEVFILREGGTEEGGRGEEVDKGGEEHGLNMSLSEWHILYSYDSVLERTCSFSFFAIYMLMIYNIKKWAKNHKYF